MIIQTQRPLARTLFAAGLALAGTIASFSVTTVPARAGTPSYSATLASAVQSPATKVVNGVVWNCDGATCAGPVDGASPKNTCAQVVKTFGQVAKFATPKGEFSAEQLQRCNAAA